jgi:toxin-antitoxin system PIN domain toxin
MKPCLADVNLVFALLVDSHDHHLAAVDWANSLALGKFGICRPVQLAVMRLLANATIMKEQVLSASASWEVLAELRRDERVVMLPEPEDVERVFPAMLRYSEPTHKLISDAWLAAMAVAGSWKLATFDAGFRQFRGLDLQLLH